VFARTRLLQLAEGMKGRRIVVYGDIVADRFIYGTPKRISPRGAGADPSPVPRRRASRRRRQRHQQHLLARWRPGSVSVLGDDAQGQQLFDAMSGQGIDCGGVLRAGRYNTPTKVRILGGMPHASRQQIVRYDIEDHCDLTESEAARIAGVLGEQMAGADAGLISDYGYGAVRQPLAATLIGAAAGKPVTLDSRYELLRFSGVTRGDSERRGSGGGGRNVALQR